jgi:hypothetical protein
MKEVRIKPSHKELFSAATILILVPLLSHLLFSWIGFTPTDEGFTLAHSRRILDGHVPHRDFIIIRPFVSPLIHVPFVLFGGEYTFWLSRSFVWFQLACISWIWVSIINQLLKCSFSASTKFFIALICFAATTHTKHITAWHTIDGLFFTSIGLTLCVRQRPSSKLVGYLLIAISPLCKQSFLFIVPLTLFILGDWRRVRYWAVAAIPGTLYVLYLVLTNALPDAISQLGSHTGLVSVGIERYLRKPIAVAVIAGYLAASVSSGTQSPHQRTKEWVTRTMLYLGPLFGTALSLWFGILAYTASLLFGLLVGVTLFLFIYGSELAAGKRILFLVLLTAWSASLSSGYNSPALVSGPILVALVACVYRRRKDSQVFIRYSIGIASIIIIISFVVAKTRFPYRDQPAANLTKSLAGVLPGASLIFTNQNTYAFMNDLRAAVESAKRISPEYAIIPDVAAYWVKAPQQNPLPAVWPHAEELNNQVLMNRFVSAMESRRSNTVFIVQKVEAQSLATGFEPLQDSDYYRVVAYAHTHFTKVHETIFFELYK